MTKLIILDRDGVINTDSMHYIKSVNEFHIIPGSLEAIAMLYQAGYQISIATNQSGIARGLYTHETLKAIHRKLHDSLSLHGAVIAHIEYCPHMPDAGCDCRKPKPGMLFNIARVLNTRLSPDVPFVGDRLTDIKAAQAAGVTPYLIQSSMTDRYGLKAYPEVPVYSSLLEWANAWLQ